MASLNPVRQKAGIPLLFAALMIIVAACAEGEQVEEEIQTPPETMEAAPPDTAGGTAQVGTADQEPYGEFLADADGRTLYMFTADTQGESSACYDACAEAWPPLLVSGEPSAASAAVDEGMLGTLERRDGSMQVTYNGWPLYYFQRDQGPGSVEGQDVHGFDGEWYLVSPDGTQIEAESES